MSMPTTKPASRFWPAKEGDLLYDGVDREADDDSRNEDLSRWADDFLDSAREKHMAFWKARGAYHPHEIQHPWEN